MTITGNSWGKSLGILLFAELCMCIAQLLVSKLLSEGSFDLDLLRNFL